MRSTLWGEGTSSATAGMTSARLIELFARDAKVTAKVFADAAASASVSEGTGKCSAMSGASAFLISSMPAKHTVSQGMRRMPCRERGASWSRSRILTSISWTSRDGGAFFAASARMVTNMHALKSRLRGLKRLASSLASVSLRSLSSAASASATFVPEASAGRSGRRSSGKTRSYASFRLRTRSREALRSLPWSHVTTTPEEP